MKRLFAIVILATIGCSNSQEKKVEAWLDKGSGPKGEPTPTTGYMSSPEMWSGFMETCTEITIGTYRRMGCSTVSKRGIEIYCQCQFDYLATDGTLTDLENCAPRSGLTLFTKGTCS